MNPGDFSRREFLKMGSVAALLGMTGCAGLGTTQAPYAKARQPRVLKPGQKLGVAQIGFGGKGQSDIAGFADAGENVVALCDADWSLKSVKEVFAKYPEAKRYRDFRKMLTEMDDQIDVVVISTPDSMHFLPALMAISMGKHVYVQKPLTHTVAEARALLEAARRHGVQTQMGNQGRAGEGTRLIREWVQGDVLGDVREVHIWTNRPVWPQGPQNRPTETPEPDPELDWDLWLGSAPYRPYNPAYHPFKWRGWWEFGCGALGDMGCHIMDASFWALDLGTPISVEAESAPYTQEMAPEWSIVTYEFPARGKMPAVTYKWYDGGKKPPRPADLEEGRELKEGGQIIIGSKATILDQSDYANSPRLIPEEKMKKFQKDGLLPEKTIPRIPESNPYKELIRAIREGIPAGSNFEYSVPLTEMVLLGNAAVRSGGKLLYDAENLRFTNSVEATEYLYASYRPGWKPASVIA